MSIFKAYDIRGIYGKELTEKEAYLIGYYLPKHLNIKKIKVGHDLRLSYEQLSKFFMQGIIDSKATPIFLGRTSTPNFYYSLFQGTNSGVMITASHNSKEYNGFKIIHEGKSFDSRNGLKDFEKIIKKDADNKTQEYEEIKESISAMDLNEFIQNNEIEKQYNTEKYTQFLKDYFNQTLTEEERNTLKNLNFALDFSSGVSSLAVKEFIKQTNLNCTLLNDTPDGNFPNHSPDPLKAKEYLKNTQNKSFFAAVFDGDGDRIIFFDEKKEFDFPDYIIALLMDYFISQNKSKENFVCDLRASKHISELAESKKSKLKLLRVGRAFYQDYMQEHSSIFGAELSGHLFFRDFKYFDNPDMALIHILKIVAQNIKQNPKTTFSQMLEKYKKYYKIEETNLEVSNSKKVLDTLKKQYKKNLTLDIDGYSFDFDTHWFNIRKSNTENVVRINFEGKQQNKTKTEFNKLIKEINSI